MQIITFVTIYAVLSQMTFLLQNTRFSRHFWVCYQAPITFNDVCTGASGRLHRNEGGEWVWSSDEEGDSDDETIQKKKTAKQVNP